MTKEEIWDLIKEEVQKGIKEEMRKLSIHIENLRGLDLIGVHLEHDKECISEDTCSL